MYDHYFSNFGSPSIPEDICKDSAMARSVLEKKIFKGFFPYKCIGKQTWPCRKKVKRQRTTILLAILVEANLTLP